MSTPSIHDARPTDQGGPAARTGFVYQDHVAAYYCLSMLLDESVVAVWLETQDDIVVLRQDAHRQTESAEFIQVKSDNLDQLWSVAGITARAKRDGKDVVGSSIAERSHFSDRFREESTFTFVTRVPPAAELRLLAFPRSKERSKNNEDRWPALVDAVLTRLLDWKSPKGRDITHWLENLQWLTLGNEEALVGSNIDMLHQYASRRRILVLRDQLYTTYELLLTMIVEASRATWRSNPDAKKLLRPALVDRIERSIAQAGAPVAGAVAPNLKRKLVDEAQLPESEFEEALLMRAQYRQALLSGGYAPVQGEIKLDSPVRARLFALRSGQNVGLLPDDGKAFHHECVTAMTDLARERGDAGFELYLGCMFDVTDRCIHRFRKAI